MSCVMKISMEIPFFPGFYETDLMNSDTSYWAIKEELEYYYQQDLLPEHPEYEHLTEDDLDFRYSDYEKDVAEAFLEVWENNAPEDIVESVEFDAIDSPRYYNFRNDRLFAFVELKDGWEDVMRHFIASNYDWLQQRIHDDWTSYDGFMSFMDNDVDEWGEHLFNEHDERYISVMIAYMMYQENHEIRNDLVMSALEDIYAGSYVYITDEGQARLDEIIAQREEDIRAGRIVLPDPAQLEIPFED